MYLMRNTAPRLSRSEREPPTRIESRIVVGDRTVRRAAAPKQRAQLRRDVERDVAGRSSDGRSGLLVGARSSLPGGRAVPAVRGWAVLAHEAVAERE